MKSYVFVSIGSTIPADFYVKSNRISFLNELIYRDFETIQTSFIFNYG